MLVEGENWYVPYHPVGMLVGVICFRIVASALMSARLNETMEYWHANVCSRRKTYLSHAKTLLQQENLRDVHVSG